MGEEAIKPKTNKCPTCGRFMRRLGLISRVRLEAECGMIRTHICIKETITYATGEVIHDESNNK